MLTAFSIYLKRLRLLLRFYIRAKTKYQVHSPFVFDWVRLVLENKEKPQAGALIEKRRRELLRSRLEVPHIDFGTGTNRQTTLGGIARRASSNRTKGRMLYRMAWWWKATQVLELGTSLGLGTAYLASGTSGQVTTIEGCPDCATRARKTLEIAGLEASVLEGSFESVLEKELSGPQSPDFIYIDGNHQSDALERYVNLCLMHAGSRLCLVLDDIYWSEDMHEGWERLKNRPDILLSIDCCFFGLLIFTPERMAKQHFDLVPFWWKPWRI
jgi:predicted O-methyltransferase YrrM